MKIDIEITYLGEDVNVSAGASQMVVAFEFYDGNFPSSSGGGAVDSVNGKTGTVVLGANDINESSTRFWLTDVLKTAYDNAVSALPNKADLVNGKVPANQLPSYVDDVVEYPTITDFPTVGENGKIYVAQDTNKTYRWTGSIYANLDEGVVLGETSSTAGRGDWVKTAYDWVIANGTNLLNHLINTSNPHNVTAAQIGAHTILNGTITTATLTGTTAETSLGYVTIPANSFSVGTVLAIESFLNRPSGAGTTIVRIRISNSATPATISSEPLVATLNISSTTQNSPFVRRNIKYFSLTSTRAYPNTTSLHEDNAAITTALSELNIDWTTERFIHLTAQPTNSADSISPYKFKLIY